MHFSQLAVALMPLIASARVVDTYSVPTFQEIHAFYPDLFPNETLHAEAGGLMSPYRYYGAGIGLIGFHATEIPYLTNGCEKLNKAWSNCFGADGKGGINCVTDTLSYTSGLAFYTLPGLIGGRQFVNIFWQQIAEQAGAAANAVGGGAAAGTLSKRQLDTCGATDEKPNGSQTTFKAGSLKIGAKNGCYAADASMQTAAKGFINQVMHSMKSSDGQQCTTSTQFTVFAQNSNLVIGRFRVDFLESSGDLCADDISGGDGCSVAP